MPLYFLSVGVFPVERLPGWMAVFVRVNPVTCGVDLMRHALAPPAVFGAGVALVVLVGFAAAMVSLALAWSRREEDRAARPLTRLELTPRALREAKRRKTWWLENRSKAPDLFDEELEDVRHVDQSAIADRWGSVRATEPAGRCACALA